MSWAPFALMALAPLMEKMFGGDKMKKVPTLSKQQQKLHDQMIKMLGGQLGQGYQGALGHQQQLMDPSSEAVSQFTQPYMREFNEQVVPGLAERFAGMGAMGGGLSSSGFGQSLSAAGSGLQERLAALKAQIGQQAAGNLMQQYGQMSGMALGTQPFAYQQQGPSYTGGLLGGWAQGGFPGMSNLGDWWSNQGPIIGNV